MPLYQVYHSYPLTQQQRQSFAAAITTLHCDAFNTPAFFVHVRFFANDATNGTYFTAGKPRLSNSNAVVAIVRTSSARSKSSFDMLSQKIEEAWDELLEEGDKTETQVDAKDKRLLMITFTPMLAVREGGMTIPEAGQEDSWLQEQLPYFRQKSDEGIEEFTELLEELEQRESFRMLLKNDRDVPKRGLSGFMFFANEQRENVREENPGIPFGQVGKILGERWKALNEKQRTSYEAKAAAAEPYSSRASRKQG